MIGNYSATCRGYIPEVRAIRRVAVFLLFAALIAHATALRAQSFRGDDAGSCRARLRGSKRPLPGGRNPCAGYSGIGWASDEGAPPSEAAPPSRHSSLNAFTLLAGKFIGTEDIGAIGWLRLQFKIILK